MHSKYLDSLKPEERINLINKLANIQSNTCYICQQQLDPSIQQSLNIDHIIPLANKGKDSEENFALTHESCNKRKLDADLRIARVLCRLKLLQDKIYKSENRSASLKDLLYEENGSKYSFQYKIENENTLVYSFDKLNTTIYKTQLFTDKLSNERTAFVEVPLEYLYHDELINPRGINSSISSLVKEFYKGNPQLHLSLARVDDNKIKIFDGQHKAVAQILLGSKKILLRLFINPDVKRLTETNTNAGSTLRQIAFDKSIMRQLNNTLYAEKIKEYQKVKGLTEDDFSFSELNLVDYFKADASKIKKYISESLKNNITNSPENKLKTYIDFEGKAKDLPISHSAFDKTFLSIFIDSKNILTKNMDYAPTNGKPIRVLEEDQLISLANIIAEEIYINKFDTDVGVSQIEKKVGAGQDSDISDEHLIAYRIGKEEVLYNFMQLIRKVIYNYFSNTGLSFNEKSLFESEFSPQLWKNIRNFVKNFSQLPLWKDRSMAKTHFSGKHNYDFWKDIFDTGKSPDGMSQVLTQPINFIEMIKSNSEE